MPTLQFISLVLFYPLIITLLALWCARREAKKARDRALHDHTLWPSERFAQTQRFFAVTSTRVTGLTLFYFYLTAASLLTILPVPVDFAALCNAPNYRAHIELDAFLAFDRVGVYFARHSDNWTVWGALTYDQIQQLYLNVFLTIPLGLFLRALFNQSLTRTFLIGSGIILFWELSQLTGVWWLAPCSWRTFSTNDLIMNGTGMLLGILLALAGQTLACKRK